MIPPLQLSILQRVIKPDKRVWYGNRCFSGKQRGVWDNASDAHHMRWQTQKPLKEGRYWWTDRPNEPPKLVYIEQQSLGLYVLGRGWLPFQIGQWAGPFGEEDDDEQS